MLALAFTSNQIQREAGGPFMPLQFSVIEAPPWLHVDTATGDTMVRDEDLPEIQGKQVFPLRLCLTCIDGKNVNVDCGIDPHRPEIVDATFALVTTNVATKVKALKPLA